MIWRCADFEFDTKMPIVMGILNVTPDSFSDGGEHEDRDAALAHAERMVEEGAAIVDVGGESTRPGAAPVGVDEELKRVLPVVRALAERGRTYYKPRGTLSQSNSRRVWLRHKGCKDETVYFHFEELLLPLSLIHI